MSVVFQKSRHETVSCSCCTGPGFRSLCRWVHTHTHTHNSFYRSQLVYLCSSRDARTHAQRRRIKASRRVSPKCVNTWPPLAALFWRRPRLWLTTSATAMLWSSQSRCTRACTSVYACLKYCKFFCCVSQELVAENVWRHTEQNQGAIILSPPAPLPPSPLTSGPLAHPHPLKLDVLCNLSSLVLANNGSNKCFLFRQVLCWKHSFL